MSLCYCYILLFICFLKFLLYNSTTKLETVKKICHLLCANGTLTVVPAEGQEIQRNLDPFCQLNYSHMVVA